MLVCVERVHWWLGSLHILLRHIMVLAHELIAWWTGVLFVDVGRFMLTCFWKLLRYLCGLTTHRLRELLDLSLDTCLA